MKKVFSIVLAVVMLMCMSVSAFAEGAFVSSPSANQAPVVVETQSSSQDCTGKVIVTSYADRNSLADGSRKILEDAATTIKNAESVTSLNSSLADIAAQNNVKADSLAISDIFNLSSTADAGHENHGRFDIVLNADTLKNFVSLMYYADGKWNIVKDAKVTNNGTHLEFTEAGMVPYAIVVSSKGAAAPSPETGDSGLVAVFVTVMTLSAAAFVYSLKKSSQSV